MIQPAYIQNCFWGLVGFRQHPSKEFVKLDDDLLLSSSGIRFNDIHPLLTMENIMALVPNFDDYKIQCWDVSTEYSQGEIVYFESDLNVSISKLNENEGNDPSEEASEYWDNTSLISIYLRNLVNAASAKLINSLYQIKSLAQNSKSLHGDVYLYDGVGNFNDLINKQDRFVGLKLTIKQADISLLLKKIGLQFTSANPEFKLYIYHSSQSEPVDVLTLEYNDSVSFKWVSIQNEVTFNYLDDTVNVGGYYSIGYYESDLIGQALRRRQSFSTMPECSTCGDNSYNNFKKWFPFLSIQPFYVDSNFIDSDDRTHWEEDHELYIDNQTWGLNLLINIVCDLSELFCRNKEAFIDSLSKQVAVDLLEAMAYSSRDNQKLKIADLAMYDLNSQTGMRVQLDKAVKALDFNMSGLNPVCLQCQDEGFKIRHRTVY